MPLFTTVTNTLTPVRNGYTADVPEDWQQGRTTYGGLSAALCVAAALRAAPQAPSLRAAQLTFVGPAAGPVRIEPTVLRAGKNSVFIGVDLFGEAGLATRATLTFGAPRPSELAYQSLPPPTVPPPAADGHFFPPEAGPKFARHFDMRQAGGFGPVSGAPTPNLLVWVRHKDPAARSGLLPLIALADTLPPAALSMFTRPAPISTVTWSLEVISPTLAADSDGWFLLQASGDHIADGYCGHSMVLWNQAGAPVLVGRQSIAIFM